MATPSPPHPPPPPSLPPSPPPPPPPQSQPEDLDHHHHQPPISPTPNSSPPPSPPPPSPSPPQDPDQNPNLKQEHELESSPSHSPSYSPSSPPRSALPPEQNPKPNTDNQQIPPPAVPVPEPEPLLKKPLPLPWTHQETTNLILAYQEKWYSLKKGQLKASQWEEVAITVAARCGYDEPSKSAIQCRHKIEKLRKRYRADRLKPRSKANAWNFFKLMDNMERGPLPINSSPPIGLIEYPNSVNSSGKYKKNDDSDSEFHLSSKKSSKSKSINRIVQGGNRNAHSVRGLRTTPMVRKRKDFYENDDEEEEEEVEEREEEEGFNGAAKLAVEIRAFAERFVRMENKKIEMMRDTERYRMEMENKRMEMILESQQKLVEMVHRAFSSSHKKLKLAAT